MSAENRKEIRYGVFVQPLRCCESDNLSSEIRVKDISTSGMGISVSLKIVKAQKIALEVTIPGNDIPLFVTGEVVWTKTDKKQDDRYHAGVKFMRLSRCDRERIVSYAKENFHSYKIHRSLQPR